MVHYCNRDEWGFGDVTLLLRKPSFVPSAASFPLVARLYGNDYNCHYGCGWVLNFLVISVRNSKIPF